MWLHAVQKARWAKSRQHASPEYGEREHQDTATQQIGSWNYCNYVQILNKLISSNAKVIWWRWAPMCHAGPVG